MKKEIRIIYGENQQDCFFTIVDELQQELSHCEKLGIALNTSSLKDDGKTTYDCFNATVFSPKFSIGEILQYGSFTHIITNRNYISLDALSDVINKAPNTIRQILVIKEVKEATTNV